jgi:hypothetical protein
MLLTLLTIPVSTAASERSFNAMRRIKTYMRSTMKNERLSSFGDTILLFQSGKV